MPETLTHLALTEVLKNQGYPCLSLFQPTHRHYPENQQDPIRYKNLCKALEAALVKDYPEVDAEPLLAPFHKVAADRNFWNHTDEGLAIFAAPGLLRVFTLLQSVEALAIVSDSFHVKPLIRLLQSNENYQVLSLTRREIKLYQGNRDSLREVKLADGVPHTMDDALGSELTEPHQTVASYGGTGLGSSMRHGTSSKQEEVAIDDERFFRAADKAILEFHSQPSGLPLILASLPEHGSVFRGVSHNPFLTPVGIDVDPTALSIDEIRSRAWETVAPEFRLQLQKLVEEFGQHKSKDLATDDLSNAALAAIEGRVKSLLVERGRQIQGTLDRNTGEVVLDPQSPGDDILDDLSEVVMTMGGNVFVVSAETMPSPTGLAAIFRF